MRIVGVSRKQMVAVWTAAQEATFCFFVFIYMSRDRVLNRPFYIVLLVKKNYYEFCCHANTGFPPFWTDKIP